MQLSYPLDQIRLDPGAKGPLYAQLSGQLRELILSGAIPEGCRLPATRVMAAELAIARNTVVGALDQLTAEGLLESRRGSGIRVARAILPSRDDSTGAGGGDLGPGLSERGTLMAAQPRVRTIPDHTAFHPGTPELARFPFTTWGRLLARRTRGGGQDLFGYHYMSGHPDLRQMIASFLSTTRRVRCTADQIVVTTGGQAALDLLARMLLDPGDTVWMEEPGYLGARSAFLSAGASLAPLPVTREGWQIPARADPSPRLIYLTPSCHHPLGVTMPAEQRLALLNEAAQANAWVIEDDFDGEYTFRGQPLPSMQGLTGQGRVIYVGTFAKTLFPAMRLGFVVLPEDLAERVKPAISVTGQYPPLLLQATLADFIDQGFFFAHLNRMRRLYGKRRALFLELMARDLSPWLEPIDGGTGMQVAALFRDQRDDRAVAAAAIADRINVAPLSLYFVGAPRLAGLLMGYAGVDEKEMNRAFPTLRAILERSD